VDRYHHGDLHQALVDAAERSLVDGDLPSLRALAREVQVSPASVYHHFADKDALQAAVATRGFERLEAAQREALAAPGEPAGRLLGLGRAYLAFALAHPATYRLMMRKDLARPHQFPALAAAADRSFQLLVEAVLEVRPEPEEARAVALEAWALAHGMISLWDLGPLRAKLGEEGLPPFVERAFRRLFG
jgi:AcrR family transcriptional regulator